MSKIFVSHSQKDNESMNFFNKIFAHSKIEAIYEEINALLGDLIDSGKVKSDIQSSSAFFLLHDNLIENILQTRDWIAHECATANALNKDVWVFEKYNQVNINELVIPQLNHLVVYDPENPDWISYINKIVDKYIPKNVAVPFAGAAVGAAVSDNKFLGGAVGAFVGLGLQSILSGDNPNLGEHFECETCFSTYTIHVPTESLFRCPVCNTKYKRI